MASLFSFYPGKMLSVGRRRAIRGISTVELLIAVMTLSVVMIGVASLLNASWQSYRNLVWQNKANMEARRALDDICDTIRTGGNDNDMTLFKSAGMPQILTDIPEYSNTGSEVGVEMHAGSPNTYYYAVGQAPDGTNILIRAFGYNEFDVAQYIDSVQFEYEYRQPAGLSQATWTLQRASDLYALDPVNYTYFYLPKTVYVTVNVRIPQSVTGVSHDYTRTLTSAVTLRGPYDNAAPPAQAILP
jgi:hypothetical protein